MHFRKKRGILDIQFQHTLCGKLWRRKVKGHVTGYNLLVKESLDILSTLMHDVRFIFNHQTLLQLYNSKRSYQKMLYKKGIIKVCICLSPDTLSLSGFLAGGDCRAIRPASASSLLWSPWPGLLRGDV